MPLELFDMVLVRRGRTTSVHRARLSDGTRVYVKLVPEKTANERYTVRLKHEWDLLREFSDCKRVINAVRLGAHGTGVALVTEDVGARTLSDIAGGAAMGLELALDLGVQVCEALEEVHGRGVVHKDVNPSNVVVDGAGFVRLIDLGLATRVSWQRSYAPGHDAEGTLAYMAPEQTGRINRSVDTRADLYSLGVTLYELVVGRVPFDAADPMEMMHAHIARQPVSAATAAGVPAPVSHIIAKLMAKAPRDRYQSAAGVRADLELCLHHVRAPSGIPDHLPVGAADGAGHFQVVHKLYGRDESVQQLLDLYEHVVRGAPCQLALVDGPSGMGKSSLVLEAYGGISRGAQLISGKFNQHQRTVPYSAVVQAMSQLVRQLLGGSDAELARWKRTICEALAPNTQLMVEVVPDLVHVVGAQPQVEGISNAAAAKERFERVFVKFVSTFCRPSAALLVFLDDLQWADAASLALLELLVVRRVPHLMLVGAYRTNEVAEDHVLSVTMARIAGSRDVPAPLRITLQPLDERSVRELVTDALGGGAEACSEAAEELAEIVHLKTKGNPFFVVQFLKAVYAEGFVYFERGAGEWRFSARDISAMDNTENVVELMTARVEEMPADTQHVLRMAACIGSHFTLRMLSTVLQRSPCDVFELLRPAVDEQLVLVTSDEFIALPSPRGGVPSPRVAPPPPPSAGAPPSPRGAPSSLAASPREHRPPSPTPRARPLSPAPRAAAAPPSVRTACVGGVGGVGASGAPAAPASTSNTASMAATSINIGYVQRRLETASLLVVSFKFLHDRVQQAAYALIPQLEQLRMHLTIGRLLRPQLDERSDEHTLQLFTVTDHLNIAAELIECPQERRDLAKLNVSAAQRARDSMAYEAALEYVSAAYELVGRVECWAAAPEFAEVLYGVLISIEFLNGLFAEARAHVMEAVEHVASSATKASFYHHLIVAKTVRGMYAKAIATARVALALLGIELPEEEALDEARDRELARVEATLDALGDVRQLADHPEISEQRWRIAVLLLTTMGPPCYRSHQRLWAVIVPLSVNICLEHGHVPSVAYSYTSLGGLMACVRGRLDWADDLAWLSLHLSEKFRSSSDKSVALLMIGSSLRHWFDCVKLAEHDYKAGYEVGLHSGNLQYSAYCFAHDMYMLFLSGCALSTLKPQLQQYAEFATSKKNRWALEVIQGVDIVVCMLSNSFNPLVERVEEYEQRVRGCSQAVVIYEVVRGRALYLMGRYREAWCCTVVADANIHTVSTQGLFVWAEHVVSRALLACVLLSGHGAASEGGTHPALPTRDELREKLEHDVALLRCWAAASPKTFASRLLLVEAEKASVDPQCNAWTVVEMYEEATRALTQDEYAPLAAAAYERGALFLLHHKRTLFASAYLRTAYTAFLSWGATDVADRLTKDHSTVLLGRDAAGRPSAEPIVSSSSSSFGRSSQSTATRSNVHIDSMALLKASQAISGEVEFDALVRTLMPLMLRMSGADRGTLLTSHHDVWQLAASALLRDDTVDICVSRGESGNAAGLDMPVPLSIVQLTARTGEVVVLDDVSDEAGRGDFARDPYWTAASERPVSLMCIPLQLRKRTAGAVIVLENSLAPFVFTHERVAVLRLLSQQVAISLDNSRLFVQYQEMYMEAVAGLLRLLPTGEILQANPACRRMLQIGDGFGAANCRKAFLVFAETGGLERWLGCVASNNGHLEGYEARLADGRGGIIWVSINAKALCNVEGCVSVVEASLHDITAAKQKAELEAERHAAIATSKAKSNFLSVVAHEIRTPLNAILCTAELAQQNATDPQLADHLALIHTAGNRLLTLLNEVLDHSKVEAGKLLLSPKPFRLRAILRDVVHIVSANVGSKVIEVLCEVGADVADELVGDDTRITQCLLNLCHNAIKFTDEGCITIFVSRAECAHLPPTSPRARDAYGLRIEVRDSGSGIDRNSIEHLFEPYRQATASTWRSHGGTGLGLAIVRQLVELMHGEVGVFSEGIGRGATFWFTLQVALDKHAPGAAPNAPCSQTNQSSRITCTDGLHSKRPHATSRAVSPLTSPALEKRLPKHARGSYRILVVEDSETNRKVAGMLCRALGFKNYAFAHDGQMAVEMAEQCKYDVVLMDLHMPVMDGLDATRAIRAQHPKLPVIGVTAAANASERHQCIQVGMDYVVQKPIKRRLLEEALVAALAPDSHCASSRDE